MVPRSFWGLEGTRKKKGKERNAENTGKLVGKGTKKVKRLSSWASYSVWSVYILTEPPRWFYY